MRNPFRRYTSRREHSSLSRKTSFLPPGVTVDYRLKLILGSTTVGDVLKCCERELFFPLLRLPILANFKGAGAGDTLLTVKGELTEADQLLPCSLTTSTQFHDFSEKDQIRFSWKEELEPPVLEGLSRYDLFNRDHVHFTSVALSIDLFRHTLITRFGGFGPAISENLTIEVQKGEFFVTIHSEGLSDIDRLPLEEQQLMKKLDSVISSLFKFAILADYQAHQGELA